MAECARGDDCVFHLTVEPSIMKRIRYAGAYPYCRGGRHEECAIHSCLQRGDSVPTNLMPDGSIGDYVDDAAQTASAGRVGTRGHRFMIVDDSMVFATIAANALRQCYPDAEVVQCHSYGEAAPQLRQNQFNLVVSGAGIGDGHTVHDVRQLTHAPIVLFTGRPVAPTDMPVNAKLVMKAAGPTALREAVQALLAG